MVEDGTMRLSEREYDEMRYLIGSVSELHRSGKTMEKRLRTIPDGWRDFRMLQTVSMRLMEKVIQTIPLKKRRQVRCDLDSMRVLLKIDPLKMYRSDDGCTTVQLAPLKRVLKYVGDYQCMFCEKRGVAAKNCQLRRDLLDMLPYDMPEFDGVECPLAESRFFETDGPEE